MIVLFKNYLKTKLFLKSHIMAHSLLGRSMAVGFMSFFSNSKAARLVLLRLALEKYYEVGSLYVDVSSVLSCSMVSLLGSYPGTWKTVSPLY